MTPNSGLLADAILLSHVLVVAFAVGFPFVLLIAAWRRQLWVGRAGWRFLHLALCAFVAGQAWLGQICPLTIWEQQLRVRAGQAAYEQGSFIEHWLHRLIFFDAPPWVFTAAYSVFAVGVLATFWLIPLRRNVIARASG